MTLPFVLTNHGIKQILRYGVNASYYTLDNDSSVESRTATSPAAELSGNGAGRQAAQFTDLSNGNTISCKLKTDYTFTGNHAINAICLCSSPNAGSNMMGRGKLASVQNVGPQDTVSIELILTIDQVTA
jgi:hypothetical protein